MEKLTALFSIRISQDQKKSLSELSRLQRLNLYEKVRRFISKLLK